MAQHGIPALDFYGVNSFMDSPDDIYALVFYEVKSKIERDSLWKSWIK